VERTRCVCTLGISITKGLTGMVVAERRTVIIGDVGADPRYLTFSTTQSEMIVPIFDRARRSAQLMLRATDAMHPLQTSLSFDDLGQFFPEPHPACYCLVHSS